MHAQDETAERDGDELSDHGAVPSGRCEEGRDDGVVPVLACHGDGAEQAGAHERVGSERHQRPLIVLGGDERLAAVHVGAGDHGERVDRRDRGEHGDEHERHLGGGELAELGSDEPRIMWSGGWSRWRS
jgi:hypothetical protein